MDRRKSEAQAQLQKLKEESKITVELLNKLLNMMSKHVNDLIKLDAREFRLCSKYFLALSHFQHDTQQKLLEINVNLEEHIIERNPPTVEYFKLINSTAASPVQLTSRESECSLFSPPILSNYELPVFKKLETENESNKTEFLQIETRIVMKETNEIEEAVLKLLESKLESSSGEATSKPEDTKFVQLENRTVSDETGNEVSKHVTEGLPVNINTNAIENNLDSCVTIITDNTNICSTDDHKINETDIPKNLAKSLSMVSVLSEQHNEGKNSVNPSIKVDESNKTENAVPERILLETLNSNSVKANFPLSNKEIENDQSSSSDCYYSLADNRSQNGLDDSYFTDSSFEEKTEEEAQQLPNQKIIEVAKPVNITEKLKSLPVMSLQEKFMNSLPRINMPDISLKPTNKKTSNLLPNETPDVKRKKKRQENLQAGINSQNLSLHKETPLEHVEIKDRPAPKLGDICMIALMETPSRFFIQVPDSHSELVDLWSTQLEDLYENTSSVFTSKAQARNKMGNFCGVKFEGIWYRAEVVDWKPEGGDMSDVVVSLVDYGNICWFNYQALRPLLKEFCYVPKMAQLCHLPYLYPPGSTNKLQLQEWSDESINGFFNICGDVDANLFKITYVNYSKERKSFEVDLININETDPEGSIGQLLIDSKVVVQVLNHGTAEVIRNPAMANQIRAACGIQGIASGMSEEEILDIHFEQNMIVEPQNVNEAVMHYNPRDEALTCRNLRPDGTCYKGSRCRLRHERLTSGFTRDREVAYDQAFMSAILPAIKSEVRLTISHVVDIQCFYAQIQDSAPTGFSINELIRDMNDPKVISRYQQFQRPPSRNQLVIAKHWNNYWYRGQIRNVYIPEGNQEVRVEVYIVDFGDTLEVPLSDLRVILPDFLRIPFKAIECRFFNVRHNEELDRNEEREYFEQQYLAESFTAHIVALPGHLEVLLKNDQNEDIGVKLIEAGYGELNQEHFFPAENEILLID